MISKQCAKKPISLLITLFQNSNIEVNEVCRDADTLIVKTAIEICF